MRGQGAAGWLAIQWHLKPHTAVADCNRRTMSIGNAATAAAANAVLPPLAQARSRCDGVHEQGVGFRRWFSGVCAFAAQPSQRNEQQQAAGPLSNGVCMLPSWERTFREKIQIERPWSIAESHRREQLTSQ
jgi:hypothetical protein